ncbi:MAG: EFR1 family ferrodoxin [Phycisphaerae bacterium]|nr:EFR1 family ferrodoxin [Phycisphaerae bacterium]
MKTTIVCFSQTGNTQRVAEAIAGGLGAGDVELVPLEKAAEAHLDDADLIGIGTPVFYYHEPTVVRDFISRLALKEKTLAFTFITSGGHPTNTLRRLQKMLAKKGATVIDSYECLGYDTYPIYIKHFRQWGHPSEEDLAGARLFGQGLVDKVRRIGEGEKTEPPRYKFVGGKYFRLSFICRRPVLDWIMPKLEADLEKCVKCGQCQKHCPTQNIRLDPWPTFLDECIFCYMCERVCPHHAIPVDWTKVAKKMGA